MSGRPWTAAELARCRGLRCVEGLDYRAIGERLGRSEQSVKSRISNARWKLPREVRAAIAARCSPFGKVRDDSPSA